MKNFQLIGPSQVMNYFLVFYSPTSPFVFVYTSPILYDKRKSDGLVIQNVYREHNFIMPRSNSVLSESDDIDELRFSPNVINPNVKLEAGLGLSSVISARKKAEVYLYKDECTRIWNANKKRLGYRPWDGEETWDNYSNEVLSPLKEALLDEDDEVIYAARAMNYGEFHRLLYLAYPWLRSLEKRVKTARRDGPVNISDWSLKAPKFDKGCFKCQIAGLRCEAKAIGVPIGSPEGRRKYKGLGCKYCIASRTSTDCDASMDCWDSSRSRYMTWTPETPVRKQKRPLEEEFEERRGAQRAFRRPEVSRVDDSSSDQPRSSTRFSLSQQNNLSHYKPTSSTVAALDKSLDIIRTGYHLLADEMRTEYSDLKDENEKIQQELEKMRKAEAAAMDDRQRMEESLSTMTRMAGEAETAFVNLEGPMKEILSRILRP
ncbi:hypothetical protein EDD18DRAFT_1467099 [Armillaria luteobubalina]|uniref:Uncharacterized protein n=1 Tax=Armillaria luteobubalina TaxID=153913 RepID=A0AA39UN14_9AGAR|nr:hypothetical protein EDD18DRAFT_1467099 [Armillaria luteobubalina]